MLSLEWTRNRSEEDLWTIDNDKASARKVNRLVKEMLRSGCADEVEGMPEPQRGDLSGYWSRRIGKKDRLVYRIKEDRLKIYQCGGHYFDK